MDNNTLWSLRLGFSGKQGAKIASEGIGKFLEHSFDSTFDDSIPAFLVGQPKTMSDFKVYEKSFNSRENFQNKRIETIYQLREWWVKRMQCDEYPLREKMTLFWHNHFVAAYEKVRIHNWVYEHNNMLRKNAFGNLKEITKAVLHTNAMVRYLDNTKNRNKNFNENLSRELLELFTLGIGNYNEQDVKNGAKGLAGLTLGENGASYKKHLQYDGMITYFGKTGKFKAEEMVEIIFEQKNAPYFIAEKLLKWFIYDNPSEDLIIYYGDYLRDQNYEVRPFLKKIFSEEYSKPTAGSKIKDPLVYILQLIDELNIRNHHDGLIVNFIKYQGMELFAQKNVKGWEGGKDWLSAQLLLQRSKAADSLCKGKNIKLKQLELINANEGGYTAKFDVKINWNKGNNTVVINELTKRLLFQTDEDMQNDFENILKYDFDPNLNSADNAVLRLFNYIVKTPEFHLI